MSSHLILEFAIRDVRISTEGGVYNPYTGALAKDNSPGMTKES